MDKRDKKGWFPRTPKGQKTPKMLEVEKMLGTTLEEDFKHYYIDRGWGQKKLSNRWGVPRNLVFAINLRGGRRSWSQMLSLNVRRLNQQQIKNVEYKKVCELCLKPSTVLERAHWVDAAQGGSSKSFNILKLCPNCHAELDMGIDSVIEKARETILYRESKKIIESNGSLGDKKEQLLKICLSIIERTP